MNEQLVIFLTNLIEFFLFFVVASVLALFFVFVYTRVTRHHELALIKENSTAAAVAFSGSLIGFALPLASTMINSINIIELVLWGVIALIVQVLVYLLIRLPMPRISERIEADELAAGIWLGTCSIVAGILNAASMTS
ncbi:MAG: DUF350 domain-containing protein [Gemmatimonadetes bacterium]|nr:DUF350 domain-containing protein [Gemmatimonadota bacterium]